MGFGRIDFNGIVFELIVSEGNTRLERWKVNRKDFPDLMRILNDKFSLGIKFVPKENSNSSDLDWLR
jgi:hypothetical protein